MELKLTGIGLIKILIISVSITLMSACGGGSETPQKSVISTTVIANPLGGSVAAIATSDDVAADLRRRKTLGVALTTPNPTADQLLNWAEINFPQYFPTHSTTLTEGPWVYRSYMQTGVLLGINAGEVYVTGGEFGGQLLKVGRVGDFVKPPIAVKRSSYENKLTAGQITGPIEKPWPAVKMHFNEEITAGIALGDFFQDGSLSIAAFSNVIHNPTGPASLAGQAYFFKRINGAWVDKTSDLLKDKTGCISPRKVLVADFNGDSKPDVFASCTGYDGPIDGKLPGEQPRFLLSQPDGTYKNVPFQFNCYCHSAAAADVRGDGFADIVVQDNAGEGVVYFGNNKNDTFTMERDRVPTYEPGYMNSRARSIWTVELADIRGTGRFDLFLGGVDLNNCGGCGWSWTSKIYKNKGNDTWGHDELIELPSLAGNFFDVYDVMFINGYVYEHRNGNETAPGLRDYSTAIRKVNIATLESTLLYQHFGFFDNGYTTSNEWIIFHDGKVKNFYAYPDISVNP